MEDRELVGVAILVMAVLVFWLWPKRSFGRAHVRRPRVEGPAHPYRRREAPARGRWSTAYVVDRTIDASWSGAARAAKRALDGEPVDADEVLPAALLDVGERIGLRELAIRRATRAFEASPDPDLAYAIARSHASNGDAAAAERWLWSAARLGQRDAGRAASDDALSAVRSRPGWPALEAALRGDVTPEPPLELETTDRERQAR